MIYLLIAVLCGSMSVVLFKIFARKGVDTMPAVTVNYATAFLLGCLLNMKGGGAVNPFAERWFMWAVVMGALFIGAFVLMSRSTAAAGVAVTSISARASLIVPVVLSSLLFGAAEQPAWDAIGVIAAALALILWRRGERGGGGACGWLLPVAVMLSFGVCHFLLKYVQSGIEERCAAEQVQSQFAALTSAIFLSAMVLGVLMSVAARRAERRAGSAAKPGCGFGRGEIAGGVALGAANFFSTYLVLYALQSLPAVVFFPVYNVGVVLVTTAVGVVCFGERLRGVQIAGMCLAIAGIVLFFMG